MLLKVQHNKYYNLYGFHSTMYWIHIKYHGPLFVFLSFFLAMVLPVLQFSFWLLVPLKVILHQLRVKNIFPWKFNLEYDGTFTKLFMHVSSWNMFPITRNLQIRVHVYPYGRQIKPYHIIFWQMSDTEHYMFLIKINSAGLIYMLSNLVCMTNYWHNLLRYAPSHKSQIITCKIFWILRATL